MFKIRIEVLFNDIGLVLWGCVVGGETLGKGVCALIMFVFELTFAQNSINILGIMNGVFMFLKKCPNGVVSGWAGMDTNNLTHQRFPTVRPIVETVIEWFGGLRSVSGVVTGVQDLRGAFESAQSADDGTVVSKNSLWFGTSTGHWF